jgi:hypothetical protein
MDTEQVRAVARQLDQVAVEIQQEIMALGSKLRALNWQSPSRDRFVGNFADLQKRIQLCAERGVALGLRASQEVDEWERVDGDFVAELPELGYVWWGLIPLFGIQPSNGEYTDWMAERDFNQLWQEWSLEQRKEFFQHNTFAKDKLKK